MYRRCNINQILSHMKGSVKKLKKQIVTVMSIHLPALACVSNDKKQSNSNKKKKQFRKKRVTQNKKATQHKQTKSNHRVTIHGIKNTKTKNSNNKTKTKEKTHTATLNLWICSE